MVSLGSLPAGQFIVDCPSSLLSLPLDCCRATSFCMCVRVHENEHTLLNGPVIESHPSSGSQTAVSVSPHPVCAGSAPTLPSCAKRVKEEEPQVDIRGTF